MEHKKGAFFPEDPVAFCQQVWYVVVRKEGKEAGGWKKDDA